MYKRLFNLWPQLCHTPHRSTNAALPHTCSKTPSFTDNTKAASSTVTFRTENTNAVSGSHRTQIHGRWEGENHQHHYVHRFQHLRPWRSRFSWCTFRHITHKSWRNTYSIVLLPRCLQVCSCRTVIHALLSTHGEFVNWTYDDTKTYSYSMQCEIVGTRGTAQHAFSYHDV